MISKTNGKTNLLLVAALLFYCCSFYFHSRSKKPEIVIAKQDSAFNINQDFLKFFSLGNNRLISDMIWIQTLLESDLERYTQRDLGNWLYLRFMTISELDPKFYENYQYGGMYLSIIKDDLKGAADLYERGLKFYPEDYKLNYQAGFNYYFELGEYAKGLKLLKKIQYNPKASALLKFIVKKLEFETEKNFETALAFLYLTMTSTQDPAIIKKVKGEIYALKAENDLNCLNKGLKNCGTKDVDGNPYVLTDGKWNAVKKFKLYRIHRRPLDEPVKK